MLRAEIRLAPSSLRRGHRGHAAVREGHSRGTAQQASPCDRSFYLLRCFPSLTAELRRGRSGADNALGSFFIF